MTDLIICHGGPLDGQVISLEGKYGIYMENVINPHCRWTKGWWHQIHYVNHRYYVDFYFNVARYRGWTWNAHYPCMSSQQLKNPWIYDLKAKTWWGFDNSG